MSLTLQAEGPVEEGERLGPGGVPATRVVALMVVAVLVAAEAAGLRCCSKTAEPGEAAATPMPPQPSCASASSHAIHPLPSGTACTTLCLREPQNTPDSLNPWQMQEGRKVLLLVEAVRMQRCFLATQQPFVSAWAQTCGLNQPNRHTRCNTIPDPCNR